MQPILYAAEDEKSHYISFRTPGKDLEKGGVEGLVGFPPGDSLVPAPNIETLEELNRPRI
ncbi:MAG: hypothetical protein AVO38_16210 [delta proteobacterium ML8_D]|nr:MAG: hypothetical protein AVO38_16210 [delta proteobacterium ML8_D]